MVDEQTRANVFVTWMDECELTSEEAAEMLGKSLRMIVYYEAGHIIPKSTLLLMDAIAEGYRPHLLRRKG